MMWPQTKPRTTPRRARRTTVVKQRRQSWGLWIAGAFTVIVLTAVVAIVGGQPSGPEIGEHWHASFKIVVCGERLPPLPSSAGDIHSHGDDMIHIHPDSAATAGRNATLAAFFNSVGLRVTPTSMTVVAKTLSNGDRCGDGRAGALSVLVNGVPSRDFLPVVPKDGDQIEVRFGP
jgi:hypothetical protein